MHRSGQWRSSLALNDSLLLAIHWSKRPHRSVSLRQLSQAPPIQQDGFSQETELGTEDPKGHNLINSEDTHAAVPDPEPKTGEIAVETICHVRDKADRQEAHHDENFGAATVL